MPCVRAIMYDMNEESAASSSPALSIIVPVYKVERYLPACLESISSQTFRDFECILVDDGSPDGCPALCDEWAARDGRFRVIHKKNEGVVIARNTGLEESRGEWVAFVDSDDRVAPGMYGEMLDAARREGADLVVCGYRDDFGEAKPGKAYTWSCKTLDRAAQLREHTKSYITNFIWNKVAKRTLFTKHALRFPAGVAGPDDAYVAFHLVFYAEKIAVVNKPFYFYNLQNQSSIMHRGVPQARLESEVFVMDTIAALYGSDKSIPPALIKKFLVHHKLTLKATVASHEQDALRAREVFPEVNGFFTILFSSLPLTKKVFLLLVRAHMGKAAFFILRKLKG